MTTLHVKVFPLLIALWQKRWQAEELTGRLSQVFYQAVGYLILTIVCAACAGSIIYNILPLGLAHAGFEFLALVYLLVLLIVVVHSFDANRIRYLLEKTEEILDELKTFEMKEGCL
jgi:hypothetical protein